jgi:hypothetical protein
MYHHRFIANRPPRLTEHFPVTIVSGARQAVKPSCCSISSPASISWCTTPAWEARHDLELILRNHPPPLILEKIPYAPELISTPAGPVMHWVPPNMLPSGSTVPGQHRIILLPLPAFSLPDARFASAVRRPFGLEWEKNR